jgi:hypothetical protein
MNPLLRESMFRGIAKGISEEDQPIQAHDMEKSLELFARQAWHVVQPGKVYLHNWHISVICMHLEALYYGAIRRLIIAVPFRAMKSLLVSVFFPVWVWLKNPTLELLWGSHNQSLANRDSVRSRRIINSPWFRSHWPDRITMTGDQNLKSRYENINTGTRIAFGMTGGVQGEGADLLGIDDAHNAKIAMWSEAERKTAIQCYDLEAATRLNDKDRSGVVIAGQRVHLEDLVGHVLDKEKGGWVVLCIPFHFNPAKVCTTPLGYRDPRTEEGEIYWKERFDEA